jgi:phosphoribosylformylglycinamidine cyclo-ligase
MSDALNYRDAGVDIDAATSAMRNVKETVRSTFTPQVLADIGSFGAMYRFDQGDMAEPVLVSSMDGVGTKLKLAFMTGRHTTVGIDIVSHCVDDILVQGAKPLFFLDYLACGKLEPGIVEDVIGGVAEGCKRAGCALIGGETAEMPGFYKEGEYDLAGSIVGVVDRPKLIDGSAVEPGDALVAISSTGLHTNGYSLVRKLVFERLGMSVNDMVPGCGRTVADELLEPHKSYANSVWAVLERYTVHGMAHITGGGITDNLPRSLGKCRGARVRLDSWTMPPVFQFIQKEGNVARDEMFRTFNMGVGFILIVPPGEADDIVETLETAGDRAWIIGETDNDTKGIVYE